MGRLVVTTNVTLDGVMQAPGHPNEDRRGGFDRGGWATAYNDEVMAREMGAGMARTAAMLFGRRTYESFYDAWAHRTDGNPFTEMMNKVDKYVASRTLTGPLPWRNSTLLEGDAVFAVAELTARLDGDLGVIGSGELASDLARHHLVDEYVLLIHPLVLGSGRRLFPGAAPPANLRLLRSVPTTSGVIIASYRPTGRVGDDVANDRGQR
jgi:dihydrofolate reductase